jgi:CheY-like chemotaxis protein
MKYAGNHPGAPVIFLSDHMPFYTTKEEGKGTGLGLATVYGIVKQNGGFICVYSEPGLGTTFKIYLPRARQAKLALQPTSLLAEGCPRGCETLLLAEDEAAVLQSTREFLSLNGYIVLEAKNGGEALALAGAYDGTIDLMITDAVMPQMGGAKLAAELASDRPEMKVRFVSGYAETTFQRHGEIDVTTRFLPKPLLVESPGPQDPLSPRRGEARSRSRSFAEMTLPAAPVPYNCFLLNVGASVPLVRQRPIAARSAGCGTPALEESHMSLLAPPIHCLGELA